MKNEVLTKPKMQEFIQQKVNTMSKKIFFSVMCFMAVITAHAQSTNTDCAHALQFCKQTSFFPSCSDTIAPAGGYWFTFEMVNPYPGFSFGFTTGINSYTLYGPFDNAQEHCGDLSGNIFSSSSTPAASYVISSLPIGSYMLVIHPTQCDGDFTISALEYDCQENTACENCIGSFAPQEGKKYLLTAWVREQSASLDKLSFDHPSVGIGFLGSSPTSAGPFTASGLIIDGWQRIEEEFTIPVGTTGIEIKLMCQTGNCLFDDIRVLPFDGSMKSYVYDPVTLRLAAELDERHYTTFYEYDEEGKLVRIKKETEKGIMTIQESKTSLPKN